ncbi:MAG: hypothetical protein IJU28_07880 [Clostridia bacterium]|nr:hypothetical protein [Clostridia bacterium]
MSIFNRIFRHKEENENGKPANWEPDEVYVRRGGVVLKVEPPDKEVTSDVADDQVQK